MRYIGFYFCDIIHVHVYLYFQEQESLLLLDAPGHRTSVLYVPSGKTKRKLPKLSALVEQANCYSHTKNGGYLMK